MSDSKTGTLVVRVVRGENVPDADKIGGGSDPYVELKHGSQVQKSTVKESTANPVWNETFRFNIPCQRQGMDWVASSSLQVNVFDKDTFGKGDALGSDTLDLSHLRMGVQSNERVPLKLPKGKGGTGSLILDVTAQDFGMGSGSSQQGAGSPGYPVGGASPHSPITPSNNNGPRHGDQGGRYPFDVTVARGENIADTDKVGKGDVVVELTFEGQVYKTKAKPTPSPDWNETFALQGRMGEQVKVKVVDKDLIGKDVLGEGVITLDGRRNQVVSLGAKGSVHFLVAGRNLPAPVGGYGGGSPGYGSPQQGGGNRQGSYEIRVAKGSKFADKDKIGGHSDVYITLELAGNKQKTKAISGPNPEWNETFTMTGTSNDTVIVKAYDKDMFTKDDLLGEGTISLRSVMQRPQQLVRLQPGGEVGIEIRAPQNAGGSGNQGMYGQQGGQMGGGYGNQNQQQGLSPGQQGQGLLRVRVISATGLMKADHFGKIDPYVLLSVGGDKQKTRTISGEVNPVWNESLQFRVKTVGTQGGSAAQDSLLLEVRDSDKFGSDDDLGTSAVSLKRLQQGVTSTEEVKLPGNGRLMMELLAEDFGGAPALGHGQISSGPQGQHDHPYPGVMGGSGFGAGGAMGGESPCKVYITVTNANGLPHLPNPEQYEGMYVALGISGFKACTHARPAQNEITWNEEFSFQLPRSGESLKVELCMAKRDGNNQRVAEGYFSLSQCMPGEVSTFMVPMADGSCGEVELELGWMRTRPGMTRPNNSAYVSHPNRFSQGSSSPRPTNYSPSYNSYSSAYPVGSSPAAASPSPTRLGGGSPMATSNIYSPSRLPLPPPPAPLYRPVSPPRFPSPVSNLQFSPNTSLGNSYNNNSNNGGYEETHSLYRRTEHRL